MANNILIIPGSASIQFSGSAANTIRLQVEASGSIAFYGSSGSLFGITDSLSGSLMSVNDISGLPILEVFSDDRIVMGTFNKNTLVVTGSRIGIGKSAPTSTLDISGSVTITGSITYNSGGVTGSLFGTSSWASNAISSSFATTASAATSITFTPSTASFATSASFAVSASWAPAGAGSGITSITVSDGLSGGVITTTGTISLNTGSAHFLDGVKKKLNTEGVVSSSQQINTGSFTGSFTGTFIGTSSVATSASFAPTILPSGVVSSSTQVSYTGLSNIPSGIVSSSNQFNALTNTSASYATRTPLGTSYDSRSITFVGNSRITDDGSGNIDIIAGSPASYAEIGSFNNENFVYVDNFGTYIQTNYTTNPTRLWTFGMDGTLTAPGLIIGTASWASNVVSSSFATTASYALNATATLPAGVISSSTQFTSLTAPFTGSFTGSFTGTLLGTSSKATSASFATTASYVLPSGLPLGTISSSLQFNTVTTPFTGSFTGSFSGSLDRFNPATLRIAVGTTAPASPAVNDLWVDTN